MQPTFTPARTIHASTNSSPSFSGRLNDRRRPLLTQKPMHPDRSLAKTPCRPSCWPPASSSPAVPDDLFIFKLGFSLRKSLQPDPRWYVRIVGKRSRHVVVGLSRSAWAGMFVQRLSEQVINYVLAAGWIGWWFDVVLVFNRDIKRGKICQYFSTMIPETFCPKGQIYWDPWWRCLKNLQMNSCFIALSCAECFIKPNVNFRCTCSMGQNKKCQEIIFF